MAGYNGYSMSNNAVHAYNTGEKPMSKWTKSEILESLPGDLRESAKRLTVAEIRGLFLRWTSWHHTSSHYNRTDFYSLRDHEEVTVEDIADIIRSRTPKEPKKASPLIKAKVHYLEWAGTRKHPKAVDHEGYALLNDNWAFLPDGTKKSRSAKGFYIIDTYSKAPKGTSDIFKEIERRK